VQARAPGIQERPGIIPTQLGGIKRRASAKRNVLRLTVSEPAFLART